MANKFNLYTPQVALKSGVQTFLFCLFSLMCMPSSAQWQSFKWLAHEQNGVLIKKAAILLPVKLDGIDCGMQLDTGVGINILYRNSLPSRYSRFLKSENLLIEQFVLASELSQKTFQLMYEKKKKPSKKCGMTNDSNLAGTLGNNSFADGSLSLDLARGLFKFDKESFQPLKDKKYDSLKIEMFESENYGSFPLVTLTLNSGEKKKMVFDTGSAPLGMGIISKSEWLKLVGLKKIDDVKPVFVPRWGQLVPCYSAAVAQPVSVGDIKFASETKAMYCDDPRIGSEAEAENPYFGLIGLAPFSENVITIDYVSKKIFIEK